MIKLTGIYNNNNKTYRFNEDKVIRLSSSHQAGNIVRRHVRPRFFPGVQELVLLHLIVEHFEVR